MCDTEFTIEQGKLWMLQTRVGKRTGRAALKMAVDMVGEKAIKLTKEEALDRITGEHLEQVLHPQFSGSGHTVLARGLGASPGAAVGRVYLTADDAQAAAERGEKVVLVRSETSPEDVHGMLAAEGILTARGGLVSHAAVVARGWGKPAVVGAEALRIAGLVVHRGRHRGRRGGLDLRRRHPRHGGAGPGPGDRRRDPPRVRDHPGLGRRGPGRPPRGPGQRRQRARRRQRPPSRGRGHRPVPDRAHVPGRGPPARSCAG